VPAYKDNKGRWYCKFYTDTWQGEKKQVLKRGFATKKEALAYEYEYKANTSHSPDITLRTLYNEFMKDYKANYRPTSYNITRSIIERHILPYFADTPINAITPMMYRKWQNEIKTKKLTDSTKKNIETSFRKLLNFAVKFYDLQHPPFKAVASIGKMTAKEKVITEKDFHKLEQYFDVVDHAIFSILFYGGLRLSELRGLTVQDFDFKNNRISINKQLIKDSPSELKTDTSKRVISMPQFVMDRIRAFLDALAADSRFPFLVWTPAIIRHRLTRYCKYAGIEPISPHTLRHSHATLLITNSIPINIISKRLGHANITTTLNIYSHCFKNSDADVVALLDSIVSK
jgi:integrase